MRRVYEGKLEGFVARRKEEAQRAREAGERELALSIARWPKPNQSLWAVNQWCWSRSESLEALQSAGGQLAAAVAGRGDLSVLEASSARQRQLEQALEQCVSLLEQAGFGTTRNATDPIQRTLEALSVLHLRPGAAGYGQVAGPGSLTEAPPVPDFSDLLDLGVTVDLSQRWKPAAKEAAKKAAGKKKAAAKKSQPPHAMQEAADGRQRQQLRRRLQARLRRARDKAALADSEAERLAAELHTAQRAAGRAETLVGRRERQLEEARAAQTARQDELETAERAHRRAELERDKTTALIRRLEAELAD